MSQEHFIKNIEIKNFKLFKDFKAEGFGRVNLIGGKNNVGKTAFMEAVFINGISDNIEHLIFSLYEIFFIRNYLEYVTEDTPTVSKVLDNIKNYSSISNIRSVEFKAELKNIKKSYRFFNERKEKGEFSEDPEDYDDVSNIQFIDNYGYTNYQLNKVYTSVQLKNKEEFLNNYIKQFDSDIKFFKIINEKPKCQVKNKEYMDLSEFGDGLKDYISIICSLYACENSYLFIDEIDNGIHYTQLDKLWEIILTISKEQNVQVFATTHSKECIESFNKIQKKLQDNENYYFEMYRNAKKDKIEMRRLDNEQLEYELTHRGRFRGE